MNQRAWNGRSKTWPGALLAVVALWWSGGPFHGASAAEAPPLATFSLAERYPLESLRQILASREDWKPFPRYVDREAWSGLPADERALLTESGVQALAAPWPNLPATLYLEYARQGNRSRFEGPYFARRRTLHSLVFAECVEGKGRFLDAAANALWAICEESSWCLPAHVGAQKAGVGLPDVAEPVVDLFAGETAVSVAWTLYLLGSELDRVSPRLRARAMRELDERILEPVDRRNDFGWMALRVTRPDRRPNNWTPWIASSVLMTALTCDADPARRVRIAHKMLRSVDGFLKYYPPDGGCDEGPGYWGRAGGSLLDCLDVLASATSGRLNVFGESLVGEIGRFIERAHIAGDYYIPIGDCAARLDPDRDLIYRYGRAIQDPDLLAMAREGASVGNICDPSIAMGRQIYAVFDFPAIQALPAPGRLPAKDVWLPSEDMQLLAARSPEGSPADLYLAAWGAHNAQSHNHNDVGNFLVFGRGQPVFVDAGAPVYEAKTFSSKRYEIPWMQSAFHNLPTINGAMQSAGRAFAAREVRCETNAESAQLRMDIAGAYAAEAKVNSWIRTVRLERGRAVEIVEDFELKEIAGETTLNLLTPLEVTGGEDGSLRLQTPGGGKPGHPAWALRFDPTQLRPRVETIELQDAHLRRAWGPSLRRIVLSAVSPRLRDTWRLRVELSER